LAAVHTFDNYIFIETSQRSNIETEKQKLAQKIEQLFLSIGAKTERGKDYPGWEPNFKSDILEISKSSYKRLFQKDPVIKVIHAGLECGVIGKKYPNLDMISIGPTIENPHSPSERLHIPSVEKCIKLLVEIMQNKP
jgi:dipeptidase D